MITSVNSQQLKSLNEIDKESFKAGSAPFGKARFFQHLIRL